MYTYTFIWYNARPYPRKTSARTLERHPLSHEKKDRVRVVADPVFPSHMDERFNPSDRLGLDGLGVGRSLGGSGATVLGLAHIGPLGLLIRHGASLLAEELLEAVDGDDEAQDHQ